MTTIKPILGADPEFFATYTGEDGKLYALPPVYFREDLGVRASKHPRHPVFKKTDNFMWHEDGAAFELSVRPQHNWEDLYNGIHNAIEFFNKRVLSKVAKASGECNPELAILPTVSWDVNRWKDKGDDFFMATRFGCDPDQDAFHYETECKVLDASLHEWRYGGGHIHVSGIKGFAEKPLPAVFSLAFTAGLAGVAYSNVPELDRLRTFLYGKPGKFRVQRYEGLFDNIPYTDAGIEYRTLSNSWTGNREGAQKVFEWLNVGIEYLFLKNLVGKLFSKINTDVQKAIVQYDQPLALELLTYIKSQI